MDTLPTEEKTEENTVKPQENNEIVVKNEENDIKTQENEENLLQKRTDFKPSDNQIKWLEAGFRINSSSATLIARELKKKHRQFYEWIDQDGFLDWWNDTWMKFYKAQQSRLIESGLKNAQNDHAWWRDMMEFFGFRKEKQLTPMAAPQNLIQVMGNAMAKQASERGVEVENIEEVKEAVNESGSTP